MIAALFPGQNSHEVGMGVAFRRDYPSVESLFGCVNRVVPGLGQWMEHGPLETLTLTAHQQPALVTASIAAYTAWTERTGLRPAFAAGHSLGEFSAYVAAKSLPFESAVQLVHNRGTYMQEAVPEGLGLMVAVMGDPDLIVSVLEERAGQMGVVEIANFNAPQQTVVSGDKRAVEQVGQVLQARGCRVIPLKVSAPFHCSLMEPAKLKLEQDLLVTPFSVPVFPVIANVHAEPVTEAEDIVPLLTQQVVSSVRWVQSIRKLHELGVREFVEFGSGAVLTGLLKRILPGVAAFNIRTPDDIETYLNQRMIHE